MKQATIAFIGGGNMARSLIGGLISDGCQPANIRVSDPNRAGLADLAGRFQVVTTGDNAEAASGADVVVLAVKPQVMAQVARSLGPALGDDTVVVSIAAGVRAGDIDRWLGGGRALVRAMPNTPSLVRSGAAGLFANDRVSPSQRDLAEAILRAGGLVVWVDDEAALDAVTAVSGSGPAYFFAMMEAMEAAATDLGLPPQTARLLVLQTAFGAAKMALESDEGPAELRRRVTSPGGTTERALQVMADAGLGAILQRALAAAAERAAELGDQLAGQD